MKKIASILAVAAALLCGCATTEVATVENGAVIGGEKPVAVVRAENYGYYLFSFVPLFAGNPDRQNENTLSLFSDTVTVENNQKMIAKEAEKIGADAITGVNNKVSWTGSFSLWIIWREVLTSNATLLRKNL